MSCDYNQLRPLKQLKINVKIRTITCRADPARNLSVAIVAIVTLLMLAESSHLVSKLVYYRRGV